MVNREYVVLCVMSFCRDAKCCISIGTYHFQPRNGIGRFCFCLMLSPQHIILRLNTSTKSPIGYISYFHSCTKRPNDTISCFRSNTKHPNDTISCFRSNTIYLNYIISYFHINTKQPNDSILSFRSDMKTSNYHKYHNNLEPL